MAELKPGDRVRVEFEGTVERVLPILRDVVVGAAPNGYGPYSFPLEYCTLIEPEIILPEIPGTIVQIDPLNKLSVRCAFESDGDSWHESGISGPVATGELLKLCRKYGYRVIPAAIPEEVK